MAVDRRRRGATPPPGPPSPPLQTKVTIEGKNEISNGAMSGHFRYTRFWVPSPPSPPSNTSLARGGGHSSASGVSAWGMKWVGAGEGGFVTGLHECGRQSVAPLVWGLRQ